MEFPELGQNCMVVECNDLDFLPITCQYCKKSLCGKHFLPDDHKCQEYHKQSEDRSKGKLLND